MLYLNERQYHPFAGSASVCSSLLELVAGIFTQTLTDPSCSFPLSEEGTLVEPLFDTPFFGVAAGDDPLFVAYKRAIGPFHWTPEEAFRLAFPEEACRAEELSVLSYVLPQTRQTREEQRQSTTVSCRRWFQSYLFGEALNRRLRENLVAVLAQAGIQAVAPVLHPTWSWECSPEYGRASTWSERHVAHAAGLGTFGLSDGLITRAGKAHRLGSVVVRACLPPTPRSYKGHHDWCLAFQPGGKCLACVRRCPAHAINEKGHDKRACEKHIHTIVEPYAEKQYGWKGADCCGLCQVGIPCENGPVFLKQR